MGRLVGFAAGRLSGPGGSGPGLDPRSEVRGGAGVGRESAGTGAGSGRNTEEGNASGGCGLAIARSSRIFWMSDRPCWTSSRV